MQLFEFYFKHFDVPSELIFEDFLEFLLPYVDSLFRFLVEKGHLPPCFQKFGLSLVREFFQSGYFIDETLNKFVFLVASLPDGLLGHFQFFV